MVVLYIYIGSVVYALTLNTIYGLATINYIKRNGYEIVKDKSTFSEKLAGLISMLVYSSIPLVNLIAPTVSALSGTQKIAEKNIPELLKKGMIRKTIISSDEVDTENMKCCGETEDWSETETKTEAQEKRYVINGDGVRVTIHEIKTGFNENDGPVRGSRKRF